MRMAICTRPLPDELWQSYIMRLAVMNDCWSLEQFEDKYIYCTKRKKRTSAAYPESLSIVCDTMADNPFFPQIKDAIAMTPYYAEAGGLSEGKQAKLAESILFDINEPVTPNYRPQKKFHFRYCPECMKKDIERYGFWYLHLKHHLPDVCVCREHKIPLILLGNFDKRKICVPNLGKGEKAEIDDMKIALLHSAEMEAAYENNKGILVLDVCSECGKEYLNHPYSERTGSGCPFCRKQQVWGQFLQHRLKNLYKEEYRLTGEFTTLGKAVVLHIPCGIAKQNLEHLLWDKKRGCSGCKTLTVPKMQKLIDPEKKEFLIRKLFRNQNDSRMVTVTHLVCGKTFDMHPKLFKDRPHCIYCEKKKKSLENNIVHPDYEIVSEYRNNREQIWFRHKECGCIFQTSKMSFLAGMRCPICTNHYDFQMVSEAICNCAGDYRAEHGKCRGVVSIYYKEDILEENVPYSKIMNDLQSDIPQLIKYRKQKYYPPKSIRRKIYDAVMDGTKEKGFWEAKDGVDGEVVTRGIRNILQDLTNQGYIMRIEKGRYKIDEDSYKYYDGNTG